MAGTIIKFLLMAGACQARSWLVKVRLFHLMADKARGTALSQTALPIKDVLQEIIIWRQLMKICNLAVQSNVLPKD